MRYEYEQILQTSISKDDTQNQELSFSQLERLSPSDRKQEIKKQTKVNPHSRRSIIKADREVRDKNRAKNPLSPTRAKDSMAA